MCFFSRHASHVRFCLQPASRPSRRVLPGYTDQFCSVCEEHVRTNSTGNTTFPGVHRNGMLESLLFIEHCQRRPPYEPPVMANRFLQGCPTQQMRLLHKEPPCISGFCAKFPENFLSKNFENHKTHNRLEKQTSQNRNTSHRVTKQSRLALLYGVLYLRTRSYSKTLSRLKPGTCM